jgi:voltage-gated potassium channel Kch
VTPGVELVVVALPEAPTTEVVVRTVRKTNPRVHIIARVHRLDDRPRILASGADAAICPETLAGVEMLKMGLAHLGVVVRPDEWDVREVAAAPE